MTSEERARRIGLNEGVFRAMNERLEELAERAGIADERLDFVCECGQADCTERIEMTHPEYERLRSDPTTFAVRPGHEREEVENVVLRGEGYNVVKKSDSDAAEVARETDPRS